MACACCERHATRTPWPPKKWNLGADEANGDILFLGQDDIAFRTPNWDTTITDLYGSFPDPYWFVHTATGGRRRSAPYPFLTREWVDRLGYMVWDQVVGDYCETWVFEIAKQIGRTEYVPDVFIEHLNPILGTAVEDATFREYRAAQSGNTARRKFQATGPERVDDASRLLSAIDA